MCDRDCDVIVSQNYSTAKEVRNKLKFGANKGKYIQSCEKNC